MEWAAEFRQQRKHIKEVRETVVKEKKRRIVENTVKENAVSAVAAGGSPLSQRDVRRAQREVQQQVQEIDLMDDAAADQAYGVDILGEGTAAERKKQRNALAQQDEEELKKSAAVLAELAEDHFKRQLEELNNSEAITLTAVIDLVGHALRDELRRGAQDVRQTETEAENDYFSPNGAQREAARLAILAPLTQQLVKVATTNMTEENTLTSSGKKCVGRKGIFFHLLQVYDASMPSQMASLNVRILLHGSVSKRLAYFNRWGVSASGRREMDARKVRRQHHEEYCRGRTCHGLCSNCGRSIW